MTVVTKEFNSTNVGLRSSNLAKFLLAPMRGSLVPQEVVWPAIAFLAIMALMSLFHPM
jgi:hypothetical protein